METHNDVRLRALKSDISARLKSVCADWPEDEFEAMIDRLAQITLKYVHDGSVGSYDRRSTDRLVEELKAALERNEAARAELVKKHPRRPRKKKN
jgi:hypothetical protein